MSVRYFISGANSEASPASDQHSFMHALARNMLFFFSDLQHIQLSCIYTEELSAVYLLASLPLSFLICPNELPALLTSALCNNTTNHT